MTDQQWRSLEAGLRSLADDTSEGAASPAVERALQAALSVREAKAVPRLWKWALAASLASVAVMSALLLRPAPTAPGGFPARPVVNSGVEDYTPWFVQRWSPAPVRGQVVRMRVSRGTAAAFGVRRASYRQEDAVEADVFIGDDGIMRAIRFVR